MAKQVISRLIDDIDGSAAAQTVAFDLDGRSYRIDLNDQHMAQLRDQLAPFIAVARRTSRHAVQVRSTLAADKDRNAAIRQWALAEGVQLPSRGRIAGSVRAAYDASDVAALYAATGLEREEEPAHKPNRRRAPRASFSAKD